MLTIRTLVLYPTDVAVDRVFARFNYLHTIGYPFCNKTLSIEFEADVIVCYRDAVAFVHSQDLTTLRGCRQGCTCLKHELFCCHRIACLTPDFGIFLEKFNIKCILLATLQLGCDAQLDTLCHTRSY